MKEKKLKILMTSAEAAPFAKEGGLADVVGSLPPALKKKGVDVRLIIPLYGSINRKKFGLKKIVSNKKVLSRKVEEKINIWEGRIPKSTVKVYFIENKTYFYGKDVYLHGGDNTKRYLFFVHAVLESLGDLKFYPDVVHAHDYHTSMIIDLIKISKNEKIAKIKTLLTIHNLQYQGKTGPRTLSVANISKKDLKTLEVDGRDGDINFMVQGILNADLINTVSKTYAKEITSSTYGAKIERVIKKREKDLFGVVNGIDTDLFNPEKDKFIDKKFSFKTIKKKNYNKKRLQQALGLEQNDNIPVVGLVSRLVWQKGLDLLTDKFGDLDCQFVFLGTGKPEEEQRLKAFAKKYPEKVSANITFSLELAQKIYASSDIFLMPSRFEPCGLGQMIAMRYGTIPVVRKTGGLADTVPSSVGFSFTKYDSKELYRTLKKAIKVYQNDKKKWLGLIKNSMNSDFSWNLSAKKYIELYKKALRK